MTQDVVEQSLVDENAEDLLKTITEASKNGAPRSLLLSLVKIHLKKFASQIKDNSSSW